MSERATPETHPDYDWDYWEAQVEHKCVICEKHSPFCTPTPHGDACPVCISVFVKDYLVMKNPWPKEVLEKMKAG